MPLVAGVGDTGSALLMHKHLRRLERVWIDAPIYFVTTCTKNRRRILTRRGVFGVLVEEWQSARERHGWVIGRYVVMPDHVHFFCAPDYEAKPLSEFVGAWKSWTSKRVAKLPGSTTPATTKLAWQPEFFDHVLRSSESYSEKWNYFRENPVRAGVVSSPDEWQYAGEIEFLRR